MFERVRCELVQAPYLVGLVQLVGLWGRGPCPDSQPGATVMFGHYGVDKHYSWLDNWATGLVEPYHIERWLPNWLPG